MDQYSYSWHFSLEILMKCPVLVKALTLMHYRGALNAPSLAPVALFHFTLNEELEFMLHVKARD